MACRCVDMKNCLNDILLLKEIVKEFSELERNSQRINDNLNKISNIGILITSNEKELIREHKRINRKVVDKTPLIINECNMKIEELEKQYKIIMQEDKMFHSITDK